MKKLISVLIVLCLLSLTVVFAPVNTYAAITASLAGPSVVRAGDTITLTFRLSPGNDRVSGVSGEFTFNSGQVSYTGKPANPPSSWKVDSGDRTFTAYDDSAVMNKYITGNNVSVFTAKFKINSNVSAGTKITISVKDIITSYNFVDTNLGTATYSVTIAPPKSTNNNLKSLVVSNAEITPVFSKNTTSYQTTVPFSVSQLNINAEPEDSKASVSVSGNNLKVGNNTVVITVTAESGAKKEYKISVVREQDPNYEPKSEARLKSLSVASDGLLSPAFSQDVTSYVVYLPYEIESIDLTGETLDGNASVDGLGKKNLAEGVNVIKVTVTAEDGKTTMDYVITVVRMPEYDGTNVVAPSETDPGSSATPMPEPGDDKTLPPDSPEPSSTNEEGRIGVTAWIVILLCGVCLAVGAVLGFVLLLIKKKR